MQKGIIKNVNRLTGEPVDAQDLASIFTGIVGNESGVLTVFDELRLEKINDNKVRLHSGVYSLKGHMLYIPKGSYEDFEIDSGTLGANRIDLLVAEYEKNGEGEGEDTLQFRVIKGETTSGTAQAPQLTQQDINSNGLTRQEALYQIKITGTDLKINYSSISIKELKTLSFETTKIKNDVSLLDKRINVSLDQLQGKVMMITVASTAEQLSPLKLIVHGNIVFLHGRVKAKQVGDKLFSIPPEFAPSSAITFTSGSAVMTVNEFGDVFQYNNTSTLHLGSFSWSIADKT